MIDFQSLCCIGRANSPEGCGRLAGDNIPGRWSNDPCALKGRWREPISFAGLLSLISAAGIRVYRLVRRSLGEGGCPSVVKFAVLAPKIHTPLQGYTKLCKPVQGPPGGVVARKTGLSASLQVRSGYVSLSQAMSGEKIKKFMLPAPESAILKPRAPTRLCQVMPATPSPRVFKAPFSGPGCSTPPAFVRLCQPM